MGLRLSIDLDTNLGNTQEAYVRIESIVVNRTIGKIFVGITVWLSKSIHDLAKADGNSFVLSGQIENFVVSYEDTKNNPHGLELTIPLFYEFDIEPRAETNLYRFCYRKLLKELKKVLGTNSIDCV